MRAKRARAAAQGTSGQPGEAGGRTRGSAGLGARAGRNAQWYPVVDGRYVTRASLQLREQQRGLAMNQACAETALRTTHELAGAVRLNENPGSPPSTAPASGLNPPVPWPPGGARRLTLPGADHAQQRGAQHLLALALDQVGPQAQVPAPQRHGDVCHAHRRTGWPELACWTASMASTRMASAISLAGWEAKGLVAGWARADMRAVLDVSGREPDGDGRKTAILAEARGFSGLPDSACGAARAITGSPMRPPPLVIGTIRPQTCLMLHPNQPGRPLRRTSTA